MIFSLRPLALALCAACCWPLSATAQVMPAVQAGNAAVQATAADVATEARFQRAMQAYEIQHFQQAYDSLVRLADEGHAEAARIALLMARHGRSLYGSDLQATHLQRQAWLESARARR